MLKEFCLQLSKDFGYEEALLPLEDGSYLLNFGQNLQISLRENSESGITLFAKIGQLPVVSVDEFLLSLMKANLLGKETGGGILGLDKEGKEIIFTQNVEKEATYKEFHETLEDFVNYAEDWQSETVRFVKEKS